MADTKTNGTDIHDLADTLWKAADALRGQVDAAEYKHVGDFCIPRALGCVVVEILES